jgi:hypothetical protein
VVVRLAGLRHFRLRLVRRELRIGAPGIGVIGALRSARRLGGGRILLRPGLRRRSG